MGNFEDHIGLKNLNMREQATFAENSLHSWLMKKNIKEIYIVGLALDYCVKYSSLQAAERGFKTYTILDATKAVFSTAVDPTVALLKKNGVNVDMTTDEIVKNFQPTMPPPAPAGVSAWVWVASGSLGTAVIMACCFFVLQQTVLSNGGGQEREKGVELTES